MDGYIVQITVEPPETKGMIYSVDPMMGTTTLCRT